MFNASLLSDDQLTQLVNAANGEPAVLDLVGQYQQAAANLQEFQEMISDEMKHFGLI